jgi:hypothetical protein
MLDQAARLNEPGRAQPPSSESNSRGAKPKPSEIASGSVTSSGSKFEGLRAEKDAAADRQAQTIEQDRSGAAAP